MKMNEKEHCLFIAFHLKGYASFTMSVFASFLKSLLFFTARPMPEILDVPIILSCNCKIRLLLAVLV